jgi:hypothetical protein
MLAEMLEQLGTEPNFLNRVVTGDKSWFFRYDPETKRQGEEWHTPHPPKQKKACMSKSKIRKIVIIFSILVGLFIKNLDHLISQ